MCVCEERKKEREKEKNKMISLGGHVFVLETGDGISPGFTSSWEVWGELAMLIREIPSPEVIFSDNIKR